MLGACDCPVQLKYVPTHFQNSLFTSCEIGFEKIVAPSRDPSPPLSFWDKMRLLLHGRLTMVVQQLTVLLHASLDPYNTTEEMELTWSQVVMDWTNGTCNPRNTMLF